LGSVAATAERWAGDNHGYSALSEDLGRGKRPKPDVDAHTSTVRLPNPKSINGSFGACPDGCTTTARMKDKAPVLNQARRCNHRPSVPLRWRQLGSAAEQLKDGLA